MSKAGADQANELESSLVLLRNRIAGEVTGGRYTALSLHGSSDRESVGGCGQPDS